MKVVNLGTTLRIFSDELTVEDRIPAISSPILRTDVIQLNTTY